MKSLRSFMSCLLSLFMCVSLFSSVAFATEAESYGSASSSEDVVTGDPVAFDGIEIQKDGTILMDVSSTLSEVSP